MSQRNCHLSPLTNGKPRIFAGFLGHLSLFLSSAGGATCPPYDLKSQKGQIEGIIRFYAASATCQGDKLKWTPTCQGTNCGARMFPGFLLNLSLFLSSALGQLGLALSVTATPCQRLGYRLGRPLGNVPPGRSGPEGRAKSRLPLWGALVPSGHRSALDRAGRRECHAKGMTERAPCGHLPGAPPAGKNASLFP